MKKRVALFFLIMVITLTGCNKFKKFEGSENQKIPSRERENEEIHQYDQNTSDTSTWQTYINQEYKFSLQFPANFKYKLLDKSGDQNTVFSALLPDDLGITFMVKEKTAQYSGIDDYVQKFLIQAQENSKNAINPSVTVTTTPITLAETSGLKVAGCDSYCGVMTAYIFIDHGNFIYEAIYQYPPEDMVQRTSAANVPAEQKTEDLKILEKEKTQQVLREQVLNTLHFL